MRTVQERHKFQIDGATQVATAMAEEACKGKHRNRQSIISYRIFLLELHAEQNPYIAARAHNTMKNLKEFGKA